MSGFFRELLLQTIHDNGPLADSPNYKWHKLLFSLDSSTLEFKLSVKELGKTVLWI